MVASQPRLLLSFFAISALACILGECIGRTAVSQEAKAPNAARPGDVSQSNHTIALDIRMVVWSDRTRYAPSENFKLNALLQNEGNSTVYVARRMAGFWDGGNLGLEIHNEQGSRIPLPFRTHLPPSPPKEGDASFLLPLDGGQSYGTWFSFPVKDFFPNTGKYSIELTYHNWLPKEFIPSQLRGQHVLGAETPSIVSKPLWIEVTQPLRQCE